MKFISYKEWKQLNESMGHTTPLSIRKPTTIGELQSRWTEMGMMPMKSKKMSMGMDDMGGDDMGGMPPMGKKKKKKGPPMPPPDMGGGEEEDDLDADADLGDIEGDEEDIEGDEDDLDADADMGDLGDEEGDEEDLEGDEDDLDGDEDELGDDMGDELEDMGDEGLPEPPPMPPKKGKGKPAMHGAAMMLKGASHMVKGMKESAGCGPDCTCKKCKKAKSKITKEEADFIDSLKDQCGSAFFDINDDGTFKEDALFTPYNPNAELEAEETEEPKPGDVGFAPQQKLGNGNELGSMAEWTKKYRRKIHEAIQAKEKPAKKGKTKAKSRKK